MPNDDDVIECDAARLFASWSTLFKWLSIHLMIDGGNSSPQCADFQKFVMFILKQNCNFYAKIAVILSCVKILKSIKIRSSVWYAYVCLNIAEQRNSMNKIGLDLVFLNVLREKNSVQNIENIQTFSYFCTWRFFFELWVFLISYPEIQRISLVWIVSLALFH